MSALVATDLVGWGKSVRPGQGTLCVNPVARVLSADQHTLAGSTLWMTLQHMRVFSGQLRQVHREPLEISERAVSQRTLMCRTQDHGVALGGECFLPTRGIQAPTITWSTNDQLV